MKKRMKKCTSILLLFVLFTAIVPTVTKEPNNNGCTVMPLGDDGIDETDYYNT